jgi:hypothetical protein
MKSKPKCIIYGPTWTPDGTRERLRWVENASDGLRIVGAAHELLPRMRHHGWHLDPLNDGDTVHGVVLALPGKDRLPRYVPAVSDPWNDDCYTVDFHHVQDDKEECARDADGMAERYADREREYQTRETAKALIEEARERIATERKTLHELSAEMRAAQPGNYAREYRAICAALRKRIAEHRAAVRDAVKEIRKLTANPYAWVEESYR